MKKTKSIIPNERIEKSILFIRGEKVLLDADLAMLSGATTKRLNEQVKHNIERFPTDFMFQPTKEEYNLLRSQFATLKDLPYLLPKGLPFPSLRFLLKENPFP